MVTDTVGDTEIEVLEKLDFESSVPCDITGCDNDAVWILTCGACFQGREFTCDECRNVLLTWPEEERIIFDNTCKHGPEIGNCPWEKITP